MTLKLTDPQIKALNRIHAEGEAGLILGTISGNTSIALFKRKLVRTEVREYENGGAYQVYVLTAEGQEVVNALNVKKENIAIAAQPFNPDGSPKPIATRVAEIKAAQEPYQVGDECVIGPRKAKEAFWATPAIVTDVLPSGSRILKGKNNNITYSLSVDFLYPVEDPRDVEIAQLKTRIAELEEQLYFATSEVPPRGKEAMWDHVISL